MPASNHPTHDAAPSCPIVRDRARAARGANFSSGRALAATARTAARAAILGAIVASAGCSTTPGADASSTSTGTPAAPRRVAIVLTNHAELGDTGLPTGFYLSEATHPYEVFHAAGYEIEFLSPKGGVAPMDGVDRRDPINAAFLDDARLVERTKTTVPIARADATRYDAVFFSGGHGTMWDFPNDRDVQELIRGVYERGGVVAAVCHGPAALVNARLSSGMFLVAGKQVSSFTDEEEVAVELEEVVPFALESTLRARGARFVEAPNFEPMVAVSERLVTGQNPASATGVAKAVVRILDTDAPAR